MAYGKPGRPRKDGKDIPSDKELVAAITHMNSHPPAPKKAERQTRWIKVGGQFGRTHQMTDPSDGFPWFISDAMLSNPLGENLDAVFAKLDEGGWKIKASFSTGMYAMLIVQRG